MLRKKSERLGIVTVLCDCVYCVIVKIILEEKRFFMMKYLVFLFFFHFLFTTISQ
jgi:hypothetical protein